MSLVNHVLSQPTTLKPEVGMGATVCFYSDRHGATVIAVSKSGKTITVQTDRAVRTDTNGMSEAQSYDHERDPNGATYVCRLTKRGWRSKGTRISLGHRSTYHDYSF